MHDLFFHPITPRQYLKDYEAKLLKKKERIIKEKQAKYNDIIPVLEHINDYVRKRMSPCVWTQLLTINGAIHPVNEPTFFKGIGNGRPSKLNLVVQFEKARSYHKIRYLKKKNS